MHISDFDYDLPEELIAQTPLNPRDTCRLLVCHRKSLQIEHRIFHEIIDFFRPGDVLVVNETRVIPARLYGTLENGRQIEVFLVHEHEKDTWLVLLKPALKAKIGRTIFFENIPLAGKVVGYAGRGKRLVQFQYEGDFLQLIESIGNVPLPPYIQRPSIAEDQTNYQTIYAKKPGAVAAPTAGLHFTPNILKAIQQMGVEIVPIVLHVGIGTFRPVIVDDPKQHQMDAEWYDIPEDSARVIQQAKMEKRRVIAVGTTVVRTLEAVAQTEGRVIAKSDWTDIFIYPPYQFKVIDGLITNFHLPKSTLLMLVAAFAGRDFILKAYWQAIAKKYRFYSYGDAMLIL